MSFYKLVTWGSFVTTAYFKSCRNMHCISLAPLFDTRVWSSTAGCSQPDSIAQHSHCSTCRGMPKCLPAQKLAYIAAGAGSLGSRAQTSAMVTSTSTPGSMLHQQRCSQRHNPHLIEYTILICLNFNSRAQCKGSSALQYNCP